MAKKKRRIEFRIFAPEAEKVLLSGSFNEWSENSDPMKRDETGTWKKIKMLPRGLYEYKFVIDGIWTLDPNCRDTVPNKYGSQNSALEVSGEGN
ncbi:MAG: glycogen-binding domain-containing protein [Desulfatiglandaceae bacterium]